MLTVPASNVSVPLTVVMRTRSSVPPREGELPPIEKTTPVPFVPAITPVAIQLFPLMFVSTKVPLNISPPEAEVTIKPDVAVVMLVPCCDTAAYPDVETEPEPI